MSRMKMDELTTIPLILKHLPGQNPRYCFRLSIKMLDSEAISRSNPLFDIFVDAVPIEVDHFRCASKHGRHAVHQLTVHILVSQSGAPRNVQGGGVSTKRIPGR